MSNLGFLNSQEIILKKRFEVSEKNFNLLANLNFLFKTSENNFFDFQFSENNTISSKILNDIVIPVSY